MSTGEHNHEGLDDLETHLKECDVTAHAYGKDYVHKHMADCIEGYEEPMNIKKFKIWITVVFFLICLTGVIPKLWSGCAKHETALSFLNCFSAGLFLGMALVHMMPEGVHLFEIWTKG